MTAMREAAGMSLNRLLHLALAAACSMAGQPTSEAKRPQFTDVAGRSRFDYISNNDLSPRKYFQQPMCGGVAILDYDRDG